MGVWIYKNCQPCRLETWCAAIQMWFDLIEVVQPSSGIQPSLTLRRHSSGGLGLLWWNFQSIAHEPTRWCHSRFNTTMSTISKNIKRVFETVWMETMSIIIVETLPTTCLKNEWNPLPIERLSSLQKRTKINVQAPWPNHKGKLWKIWSPKNPGKINHILIPKHRFNLWRVFQKTHHKIHDLEGINHNKKLILTLKMWFVFPCPLEMWRVFQETHHILYLVSPVKVSMLLVVGWSQVQVWDCDGIRGKPITTCGKWSAGASQV